MVSRRQGLGSSCLSLHYCCHNLDGFLISFHTYLGFLFLDHPSSLLIFVCAFFWFMVGWVFSDPLPSFFSFFSNSFFIVLFFLSLFPFLSLFAFFLVSVRYLVLSLSPFWDSSELFVVIFVCLAFSLCFFCGRCRQACWLYLFCHHDQPLPPPRPPQPPLPPFPLGPSYLFFLVVIVLLCVLWLWLVFFDSFIGGHGCSGFCWIFHSFIACHGCIPPSWICYSPCPCLSHLHLCLCWPWLLPPLFVSAGAPADGFVGFLVGVGFDLFASSYWLLWFLCVGIKVTMQVMSFVWLLWLDCNSFGFKNNICHCFSWGFFLCYLPYGSRYNAYVQAHNNLCNPNWKNLARSHSSFKQKYTFEPDAISCITVCRRDHFLISHESR